MTAPKTTAISITEVGDNLRIDDDEDHDLIGRLIEVVTSYLDGPSGILRNCLLTQVWAARACSWSEARLGLGNVQSIELVKYWPAGGGPEVELAAAEYRLGYDDRGAHLILTRGVLPSLDDRADAVTAHFKVGYGDRPEDVPGAVRQAMHLLVGHYYKHSEAVITGPRPTTLPLGVSALLAPFRFLRV